MTETVEQAAVIFNDEEMTILAGAGTGKTHVLKMHALERPNSTYLYLTYSQEMKKDSRIKFPSNVDVHSISSLAYKYVGLDFKDNLQDNISALYIKNILDNFSYIEANEVFEILTHYFNSDLSVPFKSKSKKINNAVNDLFSRMIDPKDSLKTPHEAYTKYFQILEIDLKYDYIIVDEAQDINKVAKSIIDAQISSKKIIVGDSLQAIYAYRGTVSLLNNSTNTLSETFRFGKNMAKLVQKFVRDYINPEYLLNSNKENLVFNGEREVYTYISRTNSHLFQKGLELSSLNIPFFIHNSPKLFRLLRDGYYLYIGEHEKIHSKEIKKFPSFDNLKKVSEDISDMELSYLVKIVGIHKGNLLSKIELLEMHLVSKEFADVILITTHKAKGLEWDNIEMANDFTPLFDEDGELIKNIDLEELHIIYVAMTRVKENIVLNKDLYKKYKEIVR
ncbi:MAG TPA: ATP-dependent helicase [Bacteroidia bacterium]|nr:ATP-dependent helicase [Bacteroidia bacterium]